MLADRGSMEYQGATLDVLTRSGGRHKNIRRSTSHTKKVRPHVLTARTFPAPLCDRFFVCNRSAPWQSPTCLTWRPPQPPSRPPRRCCKPWRTSRNNPRSTPFSRRCFRSDLKFCYHTKYVCMYEVITLDTMIYIYFEVRVLRMMFTHVFRNGERAVRRRSVSRREA